MFQGETAQQAQHTLKVLESHLLSEQLRSSALSVRAFFARKCVPMMLKPLLMRHSWLELHPSMLRLVGDVNRVLLRLSELLAALLREDAEVELDEFLILLASFTVAPVTAFPFFNLASDELLLESGSVNVLSEQATKALARATASRNNKGLLLDDYLFAEVPMTAATAYENQLRLAQQGLPLLALPTQPQAGTAAAAAAAAAPPAVPLPWTLMTSNFVERFGRAGCFTALLNAMQTVTKRQLEDSKLLAGSATELPDVAQRCAGRVSMITKLAKPIVRSRELATATITGQMMVEAANCVRVLLLSMHDSAMKLVDHKELELLLKAVYWLEVADTTGALAKQNATTLLRLDYCRKMMQSPFINLRITGLTDLRQSITDSEAFETQPRGPRLFTMPCDALAEYLVEHRVLQLLYGDNMHVEVIRRCAQVSRFLALRSKLSVEDSAMIWHSYRGKHESFRTYIHHCVLEIIECCRSHQIEHFWNMVQQTPAAEIDVAFVDFVQHFTLLALKQVNAERTQVWNDSQDAMRSYHALVQKVTEAERDYSDAIVTYDEVKLEIEERYEPANDGDDDAAAFSKEDEDELEQYHQDAENASREVEKLKRALDHELRRVVALEQKWTDVLGQPMPDFGLPVLWRAVFGADDADAGAPAATRLDVANKAYDGLCALLEKGDCALLRDAYMARCLSQVERHSSSVLAWRLLQRLLLTFPAAPARPLAASSASTTTTVAAADAESTTTATTLIDSGQFPDVPTDNGGVLDYTAPNRAEIEEQLAIEREIAREQKEIRENAAAAAALVAHAQPQPQPQQAAPEDAPEQQVPMQVTVYSLLLAFAAQRNLMSLFFADLLDYKRRVADAKAQGDAQWSLSVRGCGPLAHIDQLRARFDFLEFMLAYSAGALVLSREHLDALWQSVIVEALNDVESEYGYQWLQRLLLPKDYSVFADDSLPSYLLSERISASDPAAITREAFSFFSAFFRHVNVGAGRLQSAPTARDGDGGNSVVVVSYDELVGLDFLWRVALEADTDSVAVAASQLLCLLQRNVAPRLVASMPRLRAQYVEQCTTAMRRAQATTGGGAVGEDTRQRLLRCLALLSRFVREFECERRTAHDGAALDASGAAAASGGARASSLTTFSIVIKPVGQEPQFNVDVFNAMTIGELRELVARKWGGRAPAIVRIIWAGKELKDDRASVLELKIMPNCVVHLTQRIHADGVPVAQAPQPQDSELAKALRLPQNQPSTILSQTEHFGVIFALLELGDRLEDVGNGAWALLAELPVNADILARLRTVELDDAQLAAAGVARPSWEAMFDLDSPLALLYTLQLVHGLLTGAPTLRSGDELAAGANAATQQQAHAAAAQRFEERFVETGGLRFLLQGLLGMRTDALTAKRRESLSLLLTIVNFSLLRVEQQAPPSEAKKTKNDGDADGDDDDDDDVPPPLPRLRGPLHEFGIDGGALVQKLMQIALAAAQQPQSDSDGRGAAADVAMTSVSSSHMDDDIADGVAAGPQLPDVAGPVAPTAPPPPPPPPPPPLLPPTVPTRSASIGQSAGHVLLQRAMSLLAAAIGGAPAVGEKLVGSGDFTAWLDATLLMATDELVRERAAGGVDQVCRQARAAQASSTVYNSVLGAMLQLLTRLPVENDRCAQFFALIDVLLRDGAQVDGALGGTVGLLSSVVARVRAHPIVERTDREVVDRVLIGLMMLCDRLLTQVPADVFAAAASGAEGSLLHELYHRCLFDIASPENHGPDAPPKCKTAEARRAAFALLRRLASSGDAALRTVLGWLQPLLAWKERTTWQYLPAGMEKASSGFVGLKNLGCTCYQNSLIQQLFMIRPFRLAVLSAQLEPEETEGAPEPEADILCQLQRLFAHLQESERKYAETRDFCSSYKDIDGSPVNPNVQMDVDEFCRLLFDRLESRFKQTSPELARVIDDLFALVQLHQVISKDGRHLSERPEQDYALSLEVRNRRSVQESLELFVEGDLLEGDNKYECEGIGKVDALKRTCLKRLPRQLLVHAKRFEFDLDYMKRVKLNDRFEFPRRLDLAHFTAEGIARREALARHASDPSVVVPDMPHAPAYYQFELRGVLVHTGTADSGHYYSFIRDHAADPNAARWFEFNDTVVSPFDVSQLPAQAFGGPDSGGRLARMNNAYMLFYDRVEPPTLDERVREEEALLRAKHGAAAAADDDAAALTAALQQRRMQLARVQELVEAGHGDAATLAAFVPADIFDDVWRDNREFLTDKHTFADEFFDFMWQLAQLPALAPATPTKQRAPVRVFAKLATRFVFEVLLYAKHKTSLPQWTAHLAALFAADVASADWFVMMMAGTDVDASADEESFDVRWLERSLLRCVVVKARTLIGELLNSAVRTLALVESDKIMADTVALANALPAFPESAAMQTDGSNSDDSDDANASTAVLYRRHVNNVEQAGVQLQGSTTVLIDNCLNVFAEGELRKDWRTFEQFFVVLRDVARVGVPHRACMTMRGCISLMIDFVLGGESPYAVPNAVGEDGKAKKYAKMGDKTTAPVLAAMVETLMMLCCGAAPLITEGTPSPYAYPPPPSSPTAAAVAAADATATASSSSSSSQLVGDEFGAAPALSELDLQGLRCLKLHVDLLLNKYNVEASITMLRHLAWRDAQFSHDLVAELAAQINTLDANTFPPFWQAIHAVAGIDDELADARRDQLTTRLVAVMIDNTKYKNATMRSLDELRALAQTHDSVRRMLLVKLLPHLEALLMKSKHDRVRALTLELLQALLPTLPASNATLPTLYTKLVERPGTNNDACRLTAETAPLAFDAARLSAGDRDGVATLWQALLGLLQATRAYTRGEQQSPDAGNWQLATYFRALRWLLHAPAQQEVFCARFSEWYELFVAIDKHELIHDSNKSELVLLFLKFVTGNEAALQRFADAPDTVERLMNNFIKIAPNDALRHYNNETMPAFYMLIDHMCGYRPAALKVVLNHRNLKWALQYLFLENPEYAPIAERLWHIFRRACEAARAGASSRDIRELMNSGHSDGVHGMLMRDYVEAQRRFASPVYEGKLAPRADETDQTIYDMWRRETIAFMVSLDKMQRNPRNYFRLLEWALIAEQDRVVFVDKGGLKQLGHFLWSLVEPNGVLSLERMVHLTRGLTVLNDLLLHMGFWAARNLEHRVAFDGKWRGAAALARALHGIVSAPYAFAPLHVDLAHLALQRALVFDTPMMLEFHQTLPPTPLSLPDDQLHCPPIIMTHLLAELAENMRSVSAFELLRSVVLSDVQARENAAAAAASAAAASVAARAGGLDDARSSSSGSYDLAVLDAPVGSTTLHMSVALSDDDDLPRPDDVKRRRMEPSVQHLSPAAPLDQAESDTHAQDVAALARDGTPEGKRRVVERYLRFVLDVCTRAVDHVDPPADFKRPAEIDMAIDVRVVIPCLMRLLQEAVVHGEPLHSDVAQQLMRLWERSSDGGVRSRIVSDVALHNYLLVVLTELPDALTAAPVRWLVDGMFREARGLIDNNIKLDIAERLNDTVALALGMAQSVGDALCDPVHAEIAHATVTQLILALRALCIVLRDRDMRRHVRESCGHAVDKLLSLLAAHRDALREEDHVFDALEQLVTQYRERLQASDANDSGDESARRWHAAVEDDVDDDALGDRRALEDTLRLAEQFEDDADAVDADSPPPPGRLH